MKPHMGEQTITHGSRLAPPTAEHLVELVVGSLDDDKAEDVTVIDLRGKTSIADHMVIATGRSGRQVGAMADHLQERLKHSGCAVSLEGMPQCDWVLVDAGDIIVHLFRPEVRAFYNLEKMWGAFKAEEAQPSGGVRVKALAASLMG
jgi:ribosome-associated protein